MLHTRIEPVKSEKVALLRFHRFRDIVIVQYGRRSEKKIAVISVCSLILVAMVVALTIGYGDAEKSEVQVSSSQKAIQTICQSTDYQEACVRSLESAGNNTSDPRKLIEIGFEAAIKYINEAAENSTLLEELESDPRAKTALQNCRELADRAVNDLRRSYKRFDDLDFINVDDVLDDLKVWLSGAITYQETCLDGFEDVPGESGQKMREFLTQSMQMSSNGLAMVVDISSVLDSMGVQGFSTSASRRLLSEELPVLGHGEELPDWLDYNGRKLLSASVNEIKPDLVVAKDGSGKYNTINEALEDVPKNSDKRFVLYIKQGVYVENVKINGSMTNLMLVGDGQTKTKITGNLNFIDGTSTYHTATVAVQGDNFIAKDIGFENSAGPEKHQAVALRVSADKVIFYRCQMDGYQDTLYAHTYRQFYRDCVISGTIDFIFGDSAAVFQGCTLLVRKPLDNQQNIVTAQGRKDLRQPTGLVLQNCSFVADAAYFPYRHKLKSYLGRPWKEYSRTIIMESFLDDLIQPEGWLPWNEDFALKTLFYTEFNNRGPGADKSHRVTWTGVKELPAERIRRFTASKFIEGNKWVKKTKVPYAPEFIFPLPKEDDYVKYSKVTPEEVKDLGKKKHDKSSYVSRSDPSPSPKKESHHHSGSVPQSSIAAPPMADSYPAAPAPSPVPQPEKKPSSFLKLFYRGY
ncbi:pectinesterase [Dorcoceras hygrometricum]|uniref:Pectinesterase n=1 Tax=Dorcoceras hygrometricum TaxID=472368 RepID=A0A2Z7BZG8_9LAMI|nr:pectinesterase [Dorcoceras hygrometricum]